MIVPPRGASEKKSNARMSKSISKYNRLTDIFIKLYARKVLLKKFYKTHQIVTLRVTVERTAAVVEIMIRSLREVVCSMFSFCN